MLGGALLAVSSVMVMVMVVVKVLLLLCVLRSAISEAEEVQCEVRWTSSTKSRDRMQLKVWSASI